METIKNVSQLPQVYYGLHMVEGTAEYREEGQDPLRIYVGEQVLKNMDATFAGKPVYVEHVDEVNLQNLQQEADGYVIESFFNKSDGKHWARFIVVSDKGREAIKMGWKLSNAYVPKAFVGGGLCHGVEYDKEVTMGEYDHLAIVKNPRYEESIILTPEQFKSYNDDKDAELLKVANSLTGESKMKLNFFKRSKIDNAADLETTLVTLPSSKQDKTVAECVELADKLVNMQGYAHDDHMIKLNDDEEMSVKELRDAYNKMKHDADEEVEEMHENDDDEEKKMNDEEKQGDREKKPVSETGLAEEKKVNDEDEEEKKKKNEEEKKKNALYFEALKNADTKPIVDVPAFEMSEDKVARGKSRYGSN